MFTFVLWIPPIYFSVSKCLLNNKNTKKESIKYWFKKTYFYISWSKQVKSNEIIWLYFHNACVLQFFDVFYNVTKDLIYSTLKSYRTDISVRISYCINMQECRFFIILFAILLLSQNDKEKVYKFISHVQWQRGRSWVSICTAKVSPNFTKGLPVIFDVTAKFSMCAQ